MPQDGLHVVFGVGQGGRALLTQLRDRGVAGAGGLASLSTRPCRRRPRALHAVLPSMMVTAVAGFYDLATSREMNVPSAEGFDSQRDSGQRGGVPVQLGEGTS